MAEVINILQELRIKYLKKKEFRKDDSIDYVNYQDELSRLLFSKNGIIHKENLEIYLNTKLNSEIPFTGVVSVYGGTYQEDFSSLLHILFYDIEKVGIILDLQDVPFEMFIRNLEQSIYVLYEAYKDYLVNLVHFYTKNQGFNYLLNCYPQSMLSEPFYEHVKENVKLVDYNSNIKVCLYLKLIEKIVFSRFLELKDETINDIRDNLTKFIKSENKELTKISKRILNKLYRYNGIECPDNLIYISLLSEIEAKKLAEYTLTRYFEENTRLNAVELAFKGQLRITPDNNEDLAAYYRNNPYFSSPIIIKLKKRGYISYIYDYLENHGYILHDNKWDSISRHEYFRCRRLNGKTEFVTSNELSQSLNYKMKRKHSINNKTKDNELELLDLFLINNFKRKRIN